MKWHLPILFVACLVLPAVMVWFNGRLPPEPVQNGHRLSEWLNFYDSSWRFETNDGRHPPFTDTEIALALDKIGTNALPLLRRWLVAKPERIRPWCNAQLWRLGLAQLRLPVTETDYAGIAETGFQYYSEAAQPLLPWLLALSHSANVNTRRTAYEAAFFTRPEKGIFLPLADRVLQDRAARCEEMAAQWMVERFPEEAAKRNLRLRFPQFYHNEPTPEAGQP